MTAAIWRTRATLLTILAVIALSAVSPAQQPEVRIPEGRRHFIVVVNASSSMVGAGLPPALSTARRDDLASAERGLVDWLYSPGRVVEGPWYRSASDLITVIQAGMFANLSTGSAHTDGTFIRRTIWADSGVGRRRFLAALHPRQRPTSFDPQWALLTGLSYASVPGVSIQETFIVVLSDAPVSNTTPAEHLARLNLSNAARKSLIAKKKLIDQSVFLEVRNVIPTTWQDRSFSHGVNRVALTVLKAIPTTTATTAQGLQGLNPLDSLKVAAEGTNLIASLHPEHGFLGSPASISITSGLQAASATLKLSSNSRVRLGKVPGQQAIVTLTVSGSASNPVLGKQRFQVVYERQILLPEGVRTRWLLAWTSLFVLVMGGGVWAYRNAICSRQFKIWLPGYVTSFELPSISRGATSQHLVRLPGENGELAAVLTLPSRLMRQVFFRRATLQWDPRLQLAQFPHVERAKLTQLPAVVQLVWLRRPSSSGEFELEIVRPSILGRNHRAKIRVRFLSLTSGTYAKL